MDLILIFQQNNRQVIGGTMGKWPGPGHQWHLTPPTSDLAGQMLLGGDDLVHVGANNCLHGWPGQLQRTQYLLKVHLGLFKYQAVHSIRDLWVQWRCQCQGWRPSAGCSLSTPMSLPRSPRPTHLDPLSLPLLWLSLQPWAKLCLQRWAQLLHHQVA